jgi:ABC-type uncharacterized transport system involved in gliding motility auxiliary subunit
MGLAIIKEKQIDETEETTLLDKIDKLETIPVIQNLSNFEYDFTAALLKISMTEYKTVGFLTGHSEHKLAPNQQNRFLTSTSEVREDYDFADYFQKNYSITEITIDNSNKEISGIDTLLISGPLSIFSNLEIQAMKSFIEKGGNIIFLAETVQVEEGLSPKVIENNFNDFLSEYGINIDNKLLIDAYHGHARFSQGFFTYSLPYPYWVQANSKNLNPDNSITGQLESVVLPWVNPLNIEVKEGINLETLVTSSEYYELTEDPFNLNPQQNFNISKEAKEKLPLAVIAQKEGQGKLLVIGDADFATGTFVSQFGGNAIFFQNSVDALTLGDELISIRSKGVTDRPIDRNISEYAKNAIRWGNIILMPLLFVLYGLIRRHIRNEKKKLV